MTCEELVHVQIALLLLEFAFPTSGQIQGGGTVSCEHRMMVGGCGY